jgi:hypothetical protein
MANMQPAPGSPESHWGSRDPAHQPPRDAVLGLKRLVIETRDRLGPAATPEAIADDLRTRGVAADPAEIARYCAEPY